MAQQIPPRLARLAAALSALFALAGSALVFWAMVTGGFWWAVWAGACFVGAAALWYVADLTAAPQAGAGR